MNDSEINQQIKQMVQFIHQEAAEKANEIKLKADEEFNIEKLRMVEAEKAKIRAEYERKEKQIEVQKRISQSNEVRLGRLRALKARDDAMQAVLAETAAKLPSLTQGSGYAALLEGLILEALIQIDEPKVAVKGVAGQASAAEKACKSAAIKYKDWSGKNKDAKYASAVEISWDSSPITGGIGGVELSSAGGKISITNTLQSRLMLAYETRLPKLRATLFA